MRSFSRKFNIAIAMKIGFDYFNAAAGFGSRDPNGKIRARGTMAGRVFPQTSPGMHLLRREIAGEGPGIHPLFAVKLFLIKRMISFKSQGFTPIHEQTPA